MSIPVIISDPLSCLRRMRAEPPPHDLLAESLDRQAIAEAAASQLYRTYLVARESTPDTGAPDPVVFGSVPRVKGETC